MAKHVYNLRSRRCFSAVGRALSAAGERFGMRIVQFSVQGNHMHLVVEATTSDALSQAMHGLGVRVAKALNRVMHRRGRVLADRYHARPLRTPTEVRRALVYVRDNFEHHSGERLGRDPCSSADGAIDLPQPRTWLLRIGWRRAPPGSARPP
jgi:REP element-mobilizing transposase RayT